MAVMFGLFGNAQMYQTLVIAIVTTYKAPISGLSVMPPLSRARQSMVARMFGRTPEGIAAPVLRQTGFRPFASSREIRTLSGAGLRP